MGDLFLLLTMLLVCGGIGLPLAELLPARFTWRVAIAPTLGYAVLAVAVPVAYRHGVTIPQFFWASLVLAVASLALQARRLALAATASPRHERRLTFAAVAVCVLAALVLLAPRWVGGDQFSVFQGNHWDTFGYVDAAIVYAREPYAVVTAATDHDIVRNPLYSLAISQLSERPSVHMLYAVFSRIAPGQAYRLYYPFLVFSFLQFVQVALFVLRNAFPKMLPRAWFAVALVFPVGFWGQYVLDINAWSQIAAIPILFLLFGLLLEIATRAETELRSALRMAAVLGVTVAGAIFVYPEGLLVHSAALFPLATVVVAYPMVRARRISLLAVIPFLGGLGAVAVVLYSPQLDFLLAQLKWSSGSKVPWWDFFQGFFWGRQGRWGHMGDHPVDFAASLFSLYFATPLASASATIATLRRIAIVVTLLSLFVGLGAQLSGRLPSGRVGDTRKRLAVWGAGSLLLLAPALWFARDANYWPAGKVVSYAAPIFLTLLCVLVGLDFGTGPLRRLRWVVGAFIAFQLGTGAARIVAAHRPYGVHYGPPYPAVQGAELKWHVPWDLRSLESVLTRDTHVLIRPMPDPWLESYLMVFLYSRRIPFAVDGTINTYFGKGRNLAGLPPPWTPDVEITREDRSLVLQFHDGRPPLRVVAGGSP